MITRSTHIAAGLIWLALMAGFILLVRWLAP
jgi:hypothetical protein